MMMVVAVEMAGQHEMAYYQRGKVSELLAVGWNDDDGIWGFTGESKEDCFLHIVQSWVRWEGVVAEKFDPIPAEIQFTKGFETTQVAGLNGANHVSRPVKIGITRNMGISLQ